jgi:hypothetical protein
MLYFDFHPRVWGTFKIFGRKSIESTFKGGVFVIAHPSILKIWKRDTNFEARYIIANPGEQIYSFRYSLCCHSNHANLAA